MPPTADGPDDGALLTADEAPPTESAPPADGALPADVDEALDAGVPAGAFGSPEAHIVRRNGDPATIANAPSINQRGAFLSGCSPRCLVNLSMNTSSTWRAVALRLATPIDLGHSSAPVKRAA